MTIKQGETEDEEEARIRYLECWQNKSKVKKWEMDISSSYGRQCVLGDLTNENIRSH